MSVPDDGVRNARVSDSALWEDEGKEAVEYGEEDVREVRDVLRRQGGVMVGLLGVLAVSLLGWRGVFPGGTSGLIFFFGLSDELMIGTWVVWVVALGWTAWSGGRLYLRETRGVMGAEALELRDYQAGRPDARELWLSAREVVRVNRRGIILYLLGWGIVAVCWLFHVLGWVLRA